MANNRKEIYTYRDFFRDIWKFLEKDRLKYAFFVFLRALSEVAPFLIAYFLGKIVDFFTAYETGGSLNNFYFFVGAIGVLGVLQVLTRMWAKNGCSVIGAKTRQRVREKAMSRLMDLELQWHENESAGSKIQKVNEGSNYIYRFFSDFTNNRSVSVLMGIFGSVAIFFVLGWKYALFGLVYAGIFLLVERYYAKKAQYWTDEMSKISEKVSGKIHESTSNVLSVKSLGLREVFERSTRKCEEEFFRIWSHAKNTGQAKTKITKSFAAIGYALFLLMVGKDFIGGAITLGSILMYAAYFDKLRGSLDNISETIDGYIQIQSGTGRLMTILGEDIFNNESDGDLEIPSNWKNIEFKNISFKYKDKKVLNNFNLIIRRGEKIGIVGKSGCGKSTLTKLLLGLYKIKQGGIYIDGVNINKFKKSSVTNTITAVLQDSEMFDMTLAENISISTLKKNKNLLEKAIKISSLEDMIIKLPKGLSTLLGEKGYRVSGGERQRVGIARAIYKNSPVLILDEATSHLDSKTEQKIQESISNELNDKTLIIIAHRLSTLKNVDRIIVMKDGKIVEEGKFEELIKKGGVFFDFYTLQNKRE
ncbi:MAG: ABC transporter ATP-binding protein [Nanobdellota archaeon]